MSTTLKLFSRPIYLKGTMFLRSIKALDPEQFYFRGGKVSQKNFQVKINPKGQQKNKQNNI